MAKYGLALGGPYAFLGELGRQAEAHGFDSVWVSETSQDSIIQASVLIQATERIQVGTNITLAFPSSPVATAMKAWDLAELSGDRFVIGLGSQVRKIIEERFSSDFDHPAKRMEEYLQVMDVAWRQERGEDVTFDGEIYRCLRPGLTGLGKAKHRELPKAYLAAVGPLMTKAAATYADGILGHPFTSDRYLRDSVIPKVEEALSDAGRDRDDFEITSGVILCVSADRGQAIREAKQQIGFYGTTPNYKGVFESYDDGELMDQLRTVWKQERGNPSALADAVPDETVERYAVVGTPDEVKEQIGSIADQVDTIVLGGAWYGVSPQRMAENLWAIMQTFGR